MSSDRPWEGLDFTNYTTVELEELYTQWQKNHTQNSDIFRHHSRYDHYHWRTFKTTMFLSVARLFYVIYLSCKLWKQLPPSGQKFCSLKCLFLVCLNFVYYFISMTGGSVALVYMVIFNGPIIRNLSILLAIGLFFIDWIVMKQISKMSDEWIDQVELERRNRTDRNYTILLGA